MMDGFENTKVVFSPNTIAIVVNKLGKNVSDEFQLNAQRLEVLYYFRR
jgi:hypothetical protein